MSELDNIFDGIARSKPLNDYTRRLEPGKHRLVLTKYVVKKSAKDQTPILEADFTVLESNVHEAGEVRGWAWFIGQAGFAGDYAESRAREFIAAIGKSVGDNSDVKVLGSEMAGAGQVGRGVTIDCEVWVPRDAKGNPKLSKSKGEPITNAAWTPVNQTIEDVAAARAELDGADATIASTKATAPTPSTKPGSGSSHHWSIESPARPPQVSDTRHGVDGWKLVDMDWSTQTGVATFEYERLGETVYVQRRQPCWETHEGWSEMWSEPQGAFAR